MLSRLFLINHPDGEVPKQVKYAVLLLCFALILQIISSYFDGYNLSAFIATLFIFVYFIYAAAEGNKIARIIMSVLIALNFIVFIGTILYLNGFIKSTHPKDNTLGYLYIALYFFEIMAEILAILLLFSKAADTWYKRVRNQIED